MNGNRASESISVERKQSALAKRGTTESVPTADVVTVTSRGNDTKCDAAVPPQHRPLPAHPLAFIPDFDGEETFDSFEQKALAEWGHETPEDAYGPAPHPWRDNLRRTWEESIAETVSKKTTPLRFALLRHTVKPTAPGYEGREGILGRQIAKAAFLREHPEVLDIEIEPIILVGQNRTGTTLLHRLLSLDENSRSARAWELQNPLPPPRESTYETDPRQIKARETTASSNDFLPDLKYCHEMDFTKPEECLFAMNDDMEMGHCINTPGQRTDRVLDSAEMESVYVAHKKTLQILSYKYPPKSHWVLKCPSHLPHLQTLVRLFPKARFVWTHRPMGEVVASFCRLSSVFAVVSLPDLTPAVMGEHIMAYYTELIERGTSQRDDLGDEGRFIDVAFADMVADPTGNVRRIYEHFDLDFTPAFEARMEQYLEEDAKKRAELSQSASRAKPCLEEYGLDAHDVQDAFAAYHGRFL